MNSKRLLTPLFVMSGSLSLVLAWLIRHADGARVLMQLKTAGSVARVDALLAELGGEALAGAREGLAWDYLFIANYVFFFWLCCELVAQRAGALRVRSALAPSWWPVLLPAVATLDLAENRAAKGVLDTWQRALEASPSAHDAWAAEAIPRWIPPALTVAAAATIGLALFLVLVILRGALRARRMPAGPAQQHPEPAAASSTRWADVEAHEHQALGVKPGQRPVGLAFSGGGIRSATFNLGVLQSLARLRLLDKLQYLSTVSGGGYIGSWLHKWIDNEGLERVTDALADEASTQKPEPAAITHLRNYSNYLTPRLGLLSADTWATIATYLRNMLLNLLIIIGLGGAILLLPRAVADSLEYLEEVFQGTPLERFALFDGLVVSNLWAGLAFFALALIGILGIGISLAGAVTKTSSSTDGLTSQSAVQVSTIAPLVASAVFGAYWLGQIGGATPLWKWLVLAPPAYILPWIVAVLVASFVSDPEETEALAVDPDGPTAKMLGADVPGESRDMAQQLRRVWIELGKRFVTWAVPVSLVSGFALWGLSQLFSSDGAPWSLWRLLTLGPPLLMILFTLITVLHIGLLGRSLDDHLREWLARAGAWILIYSIGWLLLTGVSIYGPVLLGLAKTWLKACLAGGWLATSIWGAMAGNAQQHGAGKRWHGPALKLAPWIFIAGLALSLSWGLDRMLSLGLTDSWNRFATTAGAPLALEEGADRGAALAERWDALARAHEGLLDAQLDANYFWLAILLLTALAVGLSLRVAINEFSMHQYYRNRLVRAYLGASNPDRRPNPFTGFDPADDGPLGVDLARADAETARRVERSRPLHLIGAALNLVHGSRLGWQERKAAAFAFTPFHSGFSLPADEAQDQPIEVYRETAEVQDLTLGTAMAISGAAASPNMGFRSTPALTLLLTIFNVRLGWWLGNPAHPADWRRGRPRFALLPLIAELFGLTSERSHYIYLSDGGHFENLGIYELVRRRCRFIIAADGSADPDLEFADLGNAIRKCRTDFGVEIELDTATLERDADGLSRRHCAVGKIHYPGATPGSPPELGYLLYIKPSLTGDEPEDVQQYARQCRSFPHQSTGDQFFDETQFESYRALGEHIGRRIFTAARSGLSTDFPGWESLITSLRQRWVAPSPGVETSFSRHGETLDRLFDRLGRDDNLEFIDREIYPEWDDLVSQALDTDGLPNTPDQLRSGFYLCSSLIQLMENVYLDLRLDDEYSHPDNRGWINLFRQWTRSPMMLATFALSAGTFGSRFQTFCRRRFGLDMGRVTVREAPDPDACLEAVADESQRLHHAIRTRLSAPPSKLDEASPREATAGRWLAFELRVENPGLRLPVGFGLVETWRCGEPAVETDYLIYFQIHQHLRNTGLAQRGLAALTDEFPNVIPISTEDRLEGTSLRLWTEFSSFFWRAQD